MSVDILVFAPHPDDAELCCGGLLLKARNAGLRNGVIDITAGELGTRGSVALRRKEAAAASRVLRLTTRENLGLRDGHLHDDDELRVALVNVLRKHRPQILLLPHWEDQHPDHAAVGQAGLYAAWLAGVPKYAPRSGRGIAASDRLPYRPAIVLHYNNRYMIAPSVVVDITSVMDEKVALVRCFGSQFGQGNKQEKAQTRLSANNFFELLRGMHRVYGYQAGFDYGEAYATKGPLRLADVKALL